MHGNTPRAVLRPLKIDADGRRSEGRRRLQQNGWVTDGPLIVQSDKTLLLEVDHELAQECRLAIAPVRRARARARARAHLPAHPAGAVERAGRRPRRRAGRRHRCSATAGTRCRTRCWSTSPRRWAGTAGCGCSTTPRTAWCWSRTRPRGARGGAAVQEGRAAGRRPPRRRTPSSCTRPSAATSSRCCSSSAGRPRTWPGTSTASTTRSQLVEDGWALRPYQREAADGFWAGGSGVVVLPCGAGKTIVGAAAMAQAQATTLILVTNTVAARQWKARAAQAHHADRGGDRRVLRRSARRSGRSPSRRTR